MVTNALDLQVLRNLLANLESSSPYIVAIFVVVCGALKVTARYVVSSLNEVDTQIYRFRTDHRKRKMAYEAGSRKKRPK